jgi:hypothetical protein
VSALRAAAVGLAFVAACLMSQGCAETQRYVTAQAEVHSATQDARADFYRELHAMCLEERPTLESYRECMAPGREIARLADVYRATLNAAQIAITAGTEPDMAAIFAAAADLMRALAASGVPVPESMANLGGRDDA